MTLSSHQFFAKPSKCDFARTSLTYLGHVISQKGVAVDPDKIKAIQQWPHPKTIKQLRGFLGLTGYYRRFVRHYASLAAPLTNLLRKDAYIWSPAATVAFEKLRQALSTTPVLVLPNFNLTFHVHTDASGSGIGAVLAQEGRPVSYYSKQLCPRLQRTSTYNRELCALTSAVQKWRQYLLGRRPGKENAPADALSRLHETEGEAACMVTLATTKPEFGILRALRRYYATDPAGCDLVQSITTDPLKHAELTLRDGIVLWQGKLRVPEDTILKELIIYEFHNTTSGGHPGIRRTLARISANFYWKDLRGDVKAFVQHCETCQQVKAPNVAPAGLLIPLPIPDKIWSDLSMDFITHLPPSAGKTAIMVVVDRLSKYAHFSPLKHGYTTNDVAQVFIRDVIKLHGFPASIVSDRDAIFMSKFWKELFRQQGTLLAHSTAYHPQSDGQTEVVNRSLEDYLRCFVSDHQRDWIQLLPWAEYSYNTALHSSLGATPYQVVYGRPPPALLDHVPGSTTLATLEDQITQRDQLLQALKQNLARAQHRMTQQANLKRHHKEFNVGDFVWVRLQPYRQNSLRNRRTNKFAKRFYGPFQITERVGSVAYRLNLSSTARIHNVFHIALLRRFVGDPSTATQHFPEHMEGLKPVLTPDKVLQSRLVQVQQGWKPQWLVKWTGLPDSEATWEFKDELTTEFPNFHLEDKVASDGGGIDGVQKVTAAAREAHEEGTPDTTVLLRRGARLKETSRRYPADEFVLKN
ncbi:unnamed protein product [Rhodiola kirilowii]